MSERRLGSTEIASVAALYVPALAAELPKTKTAADVWARLRWGLEAPSNGRMERGLRVEPFGLRYYREHVGPWWRPMPLDEKWIVQHPQLDWASGSPDAYDAPEPSTVIELKTQADPWARKHWGTPGTDQMATRYLYQCAWLMAVSGAKRCVVVCLFGQDVEIEGQPEFIITEPALYVVSRDFAVERQLLTLGARFVEDFVRTGLPPPVKPATNRREFKARLTDECGSDAVRQWEARCIEYAAQQIGRGPGEGTEGDASGCSIENQPSIP